MSPYAASTIMPTATSPKPAKTVVWALFMPARASAVRLDVLFRLVYTCATTRYPTMTVTPIPIAPTAISAKEIMFVRSSLTVIADRVWRRRVIVATHDFSGFVVRTPQLKVTLSLVFYICCWEQNLFKFQVLLCLS